MKLSDLKGYSFDSLIYRGDNIFSIIVKTYSKKNESVASINLLDCFALDDHGIGQGILTNWSTGMLMEKYIFQCQRLSFNPIWS